MKLTLHNTVALTALLAMASPVAGQQVATGGPSEPTAAATSSKTEQEAAAAESTWKKGRPITMQYFRPLDKRGINVFEKPGRRVHRVCAAAGVLAASAPDSQVTVREEHPPRTGGGTRARGDSIP